MTIEQVTTDKLVQDMRVVIADAGELLKATAGRTVERVGKIRARAEASVRAARDRIQSAGKAVQAGAAEAAQTVNEQVHKNSRTPVGIAAGVGLPVGVL